MTHTLAKVQEWAHVDAAIFHDRIFPEGKPAVLRGLVGHWPAVIRGALSPVALCDYLMSFYIGRPVPFLSGEPSIGGHFFFRDGMQGRNFELGTVSLAAALQTLLANRDNPAPPALFVEAASLMDCLPNFVVDNRLDLVGESVAPRIWIGNAVKVQTHFDFYSNIACCVAGRRRITLFPPEQLPNLYPAPPDITLAGVPVSMVSLDDPDLQRFPRFSQALAAAQFAELEPGDALFIPFGWWHHVASLTSFNILVNYWWKNGAPAYPPLDCLLFSRLTAHGMSDSERAIWRNLFDYYVFETSGDPFAHVPPGKRGLMGDFDPARLEQVRAHLAKTLGGR